MTATRRPIRFGLKNRTQRARAIGAHLYIGCGGRDGHGRQGDGDRGPQPRARASFSFHVVKFLPAGAARHIWCRISACCRNERSSWDSDFSLERGSHLRAVAGHGHMYIACGGHVGVYQDSRVRTSCSCYTLCLRSAVRCHFKSKN